MPDLDRLYNAIVDGDAETAVIVAEEALADEINPMQLVTKYGFAAMDEVGRRFECKDYFVPELLLAGRAMRGLLDVIRPRLSEGKEEAIARVVIGTVKGDIHDIGKNLVASMLEGGGFDVVGLGVDVAPESFVAAVRDTHPRILALSALLSSTMPAMKATVLALDEAGLRKEVKVMIGGAPVAPRYADEIGADGYSEHAPGAVSLARHLIAGT